MAAIKTTTAVAPPLAPVAPQSFVVSGNGTTVQVAHVTPPTQAKGAPCISIGPTNQPHVVLTQANVQDLLATLTNFANNGILN